MTADGCSQLIIIITLFVWRYKVVASEALWLAVDCFAGTTV